MGFAWGQEGFIYLSESEVETWTLGSDKMIESGSWGLGGGHWKQHGSNGKKNEWTRGSQK